MPRELLLRRLAIAMHVGLALALGYALGSLALSPTLRVIGIVFALLPLLATLRGLLAGQSASLRWLALALVLYAGFGAVEVIASTQPAAAAVLLFALIELALVLNLTRARNSPAPRATGES